MYIRERLSNKLRNSLNNLLIKIYKLKDLNSLLIKNI